MGLPLDEMWKIFRRLTFNLNYLSDRVGIQAFLHRGWFDSLMERRPEMPSILGAARNQFVISCAAGLGGYWDRFCTFGNRAAGRKLKAYSTTLLVADVTKLCDLPSRVHMIWHWTWAVFTAYPIPAGKTISSGWKNGSYGMAFTWFMHSSGRQSEILKGYRKRK